jgi:hypothetical protein
MLLKLFSKEEARYEFGDFACAQTEIAGVGRADRSAEANEETTFAHPTRYLLRHSFFL